MGRCDAPVSADNPCANPPGFNAVLSHCVGCLRPVGDAEIAPQQMSPKPETPPETPCFVYVLGSRRNSEPLTYVGWTTDVERRLQQHNAGCGAKSTRGRHWTLLHFELCESREAAMSREWHVKRDRKFRRALREAIESD
jgi:putative endonuclease